MLLSSAVNQDGRSSTLTAPNGPSQQEVLAAAVHGAHPAVAKPVDMMEMHGTGTALGDPIEFGAAVAVISVAHESDVRLKRVDEVGGGAGAGRCRTFVLLTRTWPRSSIAVESLRPPLLRIDRTMPLQCLRLDTPAMAAGRSQYAVSRALRFRAPTRMRS
jgi:hypothetical protein